MLMCDTRAVGPFKRDFVVDEHGDIIMRCDNFLAYCFGKFSDWKAIQKTELKTITISRGGLFTSFLSGNSFDGDVPMWPKAGVRFGAGVLPIYSQHTRAVSLIDAPGTAYDYGFANLLIDLCAGVVPWEIRGFSVGNCAKMCLNYAAENGWLRSESFLKFRSPLDCVSSDDTFRGVILGACNSWLDALVVSTLTSAGYFVITQVDDVCVPGMDVAAAFGFHAIGKNKGTYVPLVLCCVLDGELFDASWIEPQDNDYFLACRRPELTETEPYVGFRPFNPALPKKLTVRDEGGSVVQQLVHLVLGVEERAGRRYREKKIDEMTMKKVAHEMCSLKVGSVLGLGQNIVLSTGTVPTKRIVVNNDTKDGIPLDNVYKDTDCWMEVRDA